MELLDVGSAGNARFKDNIFQALNHLGLIHYTQVTEISEIDRLLLYGISGIPALIANGEILFQMMVPTVEEIIQSLEKFA